MPLTAHCLHREQNGCGPWMRAVRLACPVLRAASWLDSACRSSTRRPCLPCSQEMGSRAQQLACATASRDGDGRTANKRLLKQPMWGLCIRSRRLQNVLVPRARHSTHAYDPCRNTPQTLDSTKSLPASYGMMLLMLSSDAVGLPRELKMLVMICPGDPPARMPSAMPRTAREV